MWVEQQSLPQHWLNLLPICTRSWKPRTSCYMHNFFEGISFLNSQKLRSIGKECVFPGQTQTGIKCWLCFLVYFFCRSSDKLVILWDPVSLWQKMCLLIALDSTPIHTWFFFRLYFHHCILSSVPNCSDLSHLHLLISNSDLSYSCIHSSNLKTGWTFDQIFHEVLSQWLTGLYISQNFDTLSFFVNSSYF